MELVPLKVKIGLKSENGRKSHSFPDFNQLSSSLRDDLDWSYFVDKFGGWHYDQLSGHADDDPGDDSPQGNWNGMILVPNDFAQAAVAAFPTQCSILTEAEATTFYDDRAHICDPAIKEDVDVLQAISAKRSLSIVEDQGDLDALNPDHPASGRRRNKRKTWADFKTAEGITIKK
jgi:hypothetical protein